MKLSTLACCAIAAFTPMAFANTAPVWDYASIGIERADIEGDNLTGFVIEGSKALTDNFFIMGEYSSVSDDIMGVDVDLNWTRLGGGVYSSVSSNTDAYLQLSYENLEVVGSDGDFSVSSDQDGFGASVGIRSQISPNLELYGSVGYFEFDDEDDTGVELGFQYATSDTLSIGAEYMTMEDYDSVNLTLRLAF